MGMYSYQGRGTSENGIVNFLRKKGLVSDSIKGYEQASQYIYSFLMTHKIKHHRKRVMNRTWKNAMIVQDNWPLFVEYINKQISKRLENDK